MSLVQDQDYVFFPKSYVVENRMTAKMTEACFVGTRNYIFIIPKRSTQSFLIATAVTKYDGNGDPIEAMNALLSSPELTVEKLESDLQERLKGDSETRIFSLSSLECFSMKTGFWGQTKLKAPEDKVKLVNISGRKNKTRAREFYADLLHN